MLRITAHLKNFTDNMNDDLDLLEQRLRSFEIFKAHRPEKLEELADAIYMSAFRAGLGLKAVTELIRGNEGLDDKFFDNSHGNLYDYVPMQYRAFAERLFIKKAGGGTPNAAMGKGELLLLLLNGKCTKPTKGDISFNGRQIEIKTNGGKLGLGHGEKANEAAVAFCNDLKIDLRRSATGKVARDKLVFDPTKKEDRDRVSEHLSDVLSVWWEALSGQSMRDASWPKIRAAFLTRIAEEYLTKPKTELLVFASDGGFRFFREAGDFVRYYDNGKSKFEYRGYQKNPFAIYLDVRRETIHQGD